MDETDKKFVRKIREIEEIKDGMDEKQFERKVELLRLRASLQKEIMQLRDKLSEKRFKERMTLMKEQ